MNELETAKALIVRQRKEWGEILSGFEQRNRYEIMDSDGRTLFFALEESGGTFLRILLKALRPFRIEVTRPSGETVLVAERPFRWFFHQLTVRGGDGRNLGMVRRKFAWFRRRYQVLDPSGHEQLILYGPLLHPWTFEMRRGDRSLGKITKRWSGLGREMFTDADHFGALFSERMDVSLKSVLLGAVFLIDFVHFENRGNN